MRRLVLILLAFLPGTAALAADPCELAPSHPLAALVAYLKNPGAPASLATRTAAMTIVSAFAPRVWWHKDEKYPASDPVEFVRHASLWKSIGAGFSKRISAPQAFSPAALGKLGGDYFLRHEGEERGGGYSSARPPMLWRLGEGKAAKAFCSPSATRVSVLIEYWYHEPFNYATRVGIGNHEGDWEGGAMLVDLNADGTRNFARLRAGFLSAHEGGSWTCGGEFQRVDTHPVVYSALGSHATYASAGEHEGPVLTDVTGAGRAWDAWRDLRPMVLEPYYGYRGRWGNLSMAKFMSGPEIPAVGEKFQPRDEHPLEDIRRCGSPR